MGKVMLNLCGREHELYTRDGNETRMHELAAIVETKAAQVASSMGALTEQRQLLFSALMLADELDSLRKAAADKPAPQTDPETAAALDRLADRIEAYAESLETGA